MKKLALVASAAIAATLALAGVFASASDVVDTASSSSPTSVGKVDAVAVSTPAHLLTLHCGSRKGNLKFSEFELDTLLDMAQKYPDLRAKVCEVFTKRA